MFAVTTECGLVLGIIPKMPTEQVMKEFFTTLLGEATCVYELFYDIPQVGTNIHSGAVQDMHEDKVYRDGWDAGRAAATKEVKKMLRQL